MRPGAAFLRAIGLGLALCALAAPALAQSDVVSPRPDRVAVVIYPEADGFGGRGLMGGLVMVTERRTVDLPAGRSRISFRGVAEGIVPQTVAVQGLPDAAKEQNFDYDLLTPGALILRSEGRMARVVRTNPVTGQATEERARIISAANGVVLDIDGRLESLRCSALPEKVVLDSLPPGFTDKPTLSVETVAAEAGRHVVTLSYLATGVSWDANYVARIRPDGKTLDLTAWITIANRSASAFERAPMQVLAGRLQRNPAATQPIATGPIRLASGCWTINTGRRLPPRIPFDFAGYDRDFNSIIVTGSFIRGSAEDVALPVEMVVTAQRLAAPAPPPPPPPQREDLGDYKLYSLYEPITLAAYQTKQLTLFEPATVNFRRLYRSDFISAGNPGYETGVLMVAELKNDKASGLGLPLPAGPIKVMAPGRDGRMMLIGQDNVRDTPEGLPVEIDLGDAQDVRIERIVGPLRHSGGRAEHRVTAKVDVTLFNAKPFPILAQVREAANVRGLRYSGESQKHILKDSYATWEILLQAGETRDLTYQLSWLAPGPPPRRR